MMPLAESLNRLGWTHRDPEKIDDPYDRYMFEVVAELVAEVQRLNNRIDSLALVVNSRTEHLV